MQLAHSLKGAWFQPLNLSSENLVSKIAFKFNLYRYTPSPSFSAAAAVEAELRAEVGGCTRFGIQLTHSLKASGFNP
jgi:hypothetical protein